MKKVVLLFSVLFFTCPAIGQTSLRIGSSAPDFSSISLTGDQYELSQLRGKVIVLSFWSTRCEICRVELPRLNQLAGRLPEDKVVFLAPTMENENIVNAFVRRNPARFEILPNSFGLLLQYADRTKDGSIDMGFPSFFVIDQQGLVQYRSSGYGRVEPLAQAIDRLVTRN